MEWWLKAATQGHAQAQYALALCYYNGRGVTKSVTEAIKWLRKSADKGKKEAQELLQRIANE